MEKELTNEVSPPPVRTVITQDINSDQLAPF